MIMQILAIYGLAKVISSYDGPFHILTRIRNGKDWCTVCVSVWISLLALLLTGDWHMLAGIGFTVIIEEYVDRLL